MRKIKIFLTMLAVAGVLFATSSCVDDSESASVTSLREAKADQLKAKAEFDRLAGKARETEANAAYLQAQAEEIRANAEKRLKEVEALAIEAKTAYEIEKYKADLAKLQSDVQLAIDKNIAATDSLHLQALINEANLKLQLKLLKAAVNDSISKKLGVLLTAYTTALGSVNSAKTTLASTEILLTKAILERDVYLTDTARMIERYITNLDQNIASSEKSIALYEKLIAQYEDFSKDPDADSIIAVREKELDAAVDTIETLYKAIEPAQVEYNTAVAIYDRIDARKDAYDNLTSNYYVSIGTYIRWWDNVLPTTPVLVAGQNYNYVSSGDYIESISGLKYYLSGYNFTYGENVYSVSFDYDHDGYNDYLLVTLDYTLSSSYFTSKEDYEHRSDIAQFKKDSTAAVKVAADANKELTALYKRLDSIGKKVDEYKAAKEEAQKAYENYLEAFDPATANNNAIVLLNNLHKAWNGQIDYDGIYSGTTLIVRDSTGGAEGLYTKASDSYTSTNAKIVTVRDELAAALSTIITKGEAIAAINENLKILSYGPAEKLAAELTAADKVKSEKYEVLEDAQTDYATYVKLTSILRGEINTLLTSRYGLAEGSYYDGANGQWYYDATQWKTETESYIQYQIDLYKNQIGYVQNDIARYTLQKENAVAVLYAGDRYNSAIGSSLIIDIINYYNQQIDLLTKTKIEAEKSILVYQKQADLLNAAIETLLEAAIEEE